MAKFKIMPMADSSVMFLNSIRDTIFMDPDYQRPGGVWSLSKKQLLIDSLINEYDIPKLYFHDVTSDAETDYEYAIVDGRQRMEAILDFLDGKYALDKNFRYLKDAEVDASGMNYKQLADEYPQLSTRLLSRTLAVMIVQTEDLDFIEDMFSRLNEAVPLNAAEKRNAFGGVIPKVIRDVAAHKFFTHQIRVPESRYRHLDIASKLLHLFHAGEVVDTKKAHLDFFVKENKDMSDKQAASLCHEVTSVLDAMVETFVDKDPLLKSSGIIPVYFVLFWKSQEERWPVSPTRKMLLDFEEKRAENRKLFAETADNDEKVEEEGKVDFTLIEFDDLMQSSNDAASIKGRFSRLKEFVLEQQ